MILRKAEARDARRLFEVSANPNVMRYYGEPIYTTFKKAVDEIEWIQSLEKDGAGFRWVIANEDDTYIGNVGVFGFDPHHNRVEMGYQLDEAYWGQGIMTQAIQSVLERCFHEKYYNRVQAVIDPRNTASKKVLLKCGFKYEGLLRQYEFENGVYVDVEMYAILCDEFVKHGKTPSTQ